MVIETTIAEFWRGFWIGVGVGAIVVISIIWFSEWLAKTQNTNNMSEDKGNN